MAEKVDPQSVDALTTSVVKSIAEAGAFAMAQRMQDEVAHARRINTMAEAHLGKLLSNFTATDPTAAVSAMKLYKSEADNGINTLLAQLGAAQIGNKVAETTPVDSGLVQLLGQLITLVTNSQIQQKATVTTPPVTEK